MLALSLGLLAALAWGSHDFLIRRVAPEGTVLPQLAAVMLVAMVVVQPLALSGPLAMPDVMGLGQAVLAGLCYFAASLALYLAFAAAPARQVAPITGAYPIPALAVVALAGQPVGAGQWLAALVIVGGIGLLAQAGRVEAASLRRETFLYAGLACLGMGVALALGQFAAARIPGMLAPAISRIAAGVAALALLMALRPGLASWRRHGGLLLAMGCLDGLALTAVLVAGHLPHAAYAAVASCLFALVNVVLSWVFRGEALSRPQMAGMGLVFGGLALLSALPA